MRVIEAIAMVVGLLAAAAALGVGAHLVKESFVTVPQGRSIAAHLGLTQAQLEAEAARWEQIRRRDLLLAKARAVASSTTRASGPDSNFVDIKPSSTLPSSAAELVRMVAADQRRNLPGPTQNGVRLDRVWVEDGDLCRQYRTDDRTIAELLKDPDRNAATHDLLKARLIQEVKNDDTLRDIVMGGHTIWHTYVDSSGEYLIDLGCRREDLQAY